MIITDSFLLLNCGSDLHTASLGVSVHSTLDNVSSPVLLSAPREKSIKTIQDEIRSVIRQITATVTFLPLLETPCE